MINLKYVNNLEIGRVIKVYVRRSWEYLNSFMVSKIGRYNLSIKDMDEQQIIDELYFLKANHLINFEFPTHNIDLRQYLTVELNPPILNYFVIKKDKSKAKTYKIFTELRLWLALIISIISLILSAMKT